MNTQNYIVNDIKPMEVTSLIKGVQTTFNQLTHTHLPVSKDGVYVGCIAETDAHCFESDKTIADFQYALETFYVRRQTNWLDILEAFALNACNIMPVLSENGTYLGYYELGDIMSLFNNTPFLNEAGGIIVVEKGSADYSFSEICQIVEADGGKILGAFISKIENDVTQATVKIGHTGMNSIVQTFRRYSYNVVSEHQEDKMLKDLKERSDYLNKYLNI